MSLTIVRDKIVQPGAKYASGDHIRCAGGRAAPIIADVAMVVLCKTDSSRDAAWRSLLSMLNGSYAAAAVGYQMELHANNTMILGSNGASNVGSTTVTTAADGYCLHILAKATGNTIVRYHRYKYSTGVWVHENLGSSVLNCTAGSTIEIGGDYGSSTDHFVGDIVAAAIYDWKIDAGGDGVVLGMAFNYDWWWRLRPAGFWRPNGKAYVRDLTGYGANEVPGNRVGISLSTMTVTTLPSPTIDDRQPRDILLVGTTGGATTFTKTASMISGGSSIGAADVWNAVKTALLKSDASSLGAADVDTSVETTQLVSGGSKLSAADQRTSVKTASPTVGGSSLGAADSDTSVETTQMISGGSKLSAADVATTVESAQMISGSSILSAADVATTVEGAQFIQGNSKLSAADSVTTTDTAQMVVGNSALSAAKVSSLIKTAQFIMGGNALSAAKARTAQRTAAMVSRVTMSAADIWASTKSASFIVSNAALSDAKIVFYNKTTKFITRPVLGALKFLVSVFHGGSVTLSETVSGEASLSESTSASVELIERLTK